MRSRKDFLSELDLVIEVDDQIIGNIMYTKAKLIDESGAEKDILFYAVSLLFDERNILLSYENELVLIRKAVYAV